MDGVNYLVPVDARLERDVDVRFETVTLDDLLMSTIGASLRLVILDACRNNPLARSMQRTAATRSVSGGGFGDLNEELWGDETLVPMRRRARRRRMGRRGTVSAQRRCRRVLVPSRAGTGARSDERGPTSARACVGSARALPARRDGPRNGDRLRGRVG